MEYLLRFSINYDDTYWNRETYEEDERSFYMDLIKTLEVRDAEIVDWYIDFRNGTPELAAAITERCRTEGYTFHLGALPIYTAQEVATARYVVLGSRGEVVDMDDEGNVLNEYKDILCESCGNTSERKVPNPFRVYSKRVERPRDLFGAMNGVNILSILAFELLRSEIEPWIDFGQVQIVDKRRRPVESAYEYVWVRPTIHVGRFVNARVKQTCDKCGSPTEIRMERSSDIFERNKWIVKSFNNVHAPVVLAGNWFGEIYPGGMAKVTRDVFISGSLHEKIRKLKLKGFVEAEYVIHAADEPYEWDPLKDYHP